MMWRHVASNALTLLIVALVAIGGVIAWGQAQYTRPGPLAEAICVQVEQGSTMREVSRQLDETGAITFPAILRIGADYTDRAEDLKAGSFRVPANASMAEIVEAVTQNGQSTCGTEVVYMVGVTETEVRVRELEPTSNEFTTTAAFAPDAESLPPAYETARSQAETRYRVAVAEGATSWQIVDALRKVSFLEGELAEVPPEGSLAPFSYEVEPGSSREALLARMSDLQSDWLAEAWSNREADLPLESPEEALILASLVEKETGIAAERPLVASVFVNRLRQGMRLQTDPAVIYGITGGEGPLTRGIRQSELEADTPYNTYVVDGLPPTPIANPGRESIAAAVDPAETDYLYFVADGSGGHAFAEALSQHNENVAEWRRLEAERPSQ